MIEAGTHLVFGEDVMNEIARLDILVKDENALTAMRRDEPEGNAHALHAEVHDARSFEVQGYCLLRVGAVLADRTGDGPGQLVVFFLAILFEIEHDVPKIEWHNHAVSKSVAVVILEDDRTESGNQDLLQAVVVLTLRRRRETKRGNAR